MANDYYIPEEDGQDAYNEQEAYVYYTLNNLNELFTMFGYEPVMEIIKKDYPLMFNSMKEYIKWTN